MTNLNLYRIFIEVARQQNISKASEKLFISQPAVSFSIKELESQLGQPLFLRKSKGVTLTSFGKIVFEKIAPIIDQFDDIEVTAKNFSSLKEGVLRIGSSSSNLNQRLFDFLSIFAKRYPKIKIVMMRGSKEELISKLRSGEIDVIFIDECEETAEFSRFAEFNITYQLIGNKDFKKRFKGDNIDLKDFPYEYLMLPSSANSSRTTIDAFFRQNGVSLKPRYELDNYVLLYEFVKAGFGVAFVSKEYYKNQISKKEVDVIYPEFNITARKLVGFTNKVQTNPSAIQFIEIVKSLASKK